MSAIFIILYKVYKMKVHYIKNRETDYTSCGKEITENIRLSTDLNDCNCKKCKRISIFPSQEHYNHLINT